MKAPTSYRRRWVLGPLLVATLAAAVWVGDEGAGADDRPAARRQRPSPPPGAPDGDRGGAPPPVAGEKAAPADSGLAGGAPVDPFRAKSWYVAPPPPPPVRPKAPPLPFRYLGRLSEDGETRVFAEYRGRHLVLRPGDVIDNIYAVEAVGNGQVVFSYLPLKERQQLAIGPA